MHGPLNVKIEIVLHVPSNAQAYIDSLW